MTPYNVKPLLMLFSDKICSPDDCVFDKWMDYRFFDEHNSGVLFDLGTILFMMI